MTENKTTLPSLRNPNWNKIKEETEKVNKLLPNIRAGYVTEPKELIYAKASAKEPKQKHKTYMRN